MAASKSLLQSWRWYGPEDPVSLQDVRQAGARGVVSALHHISHGEVWPLPEILKRQQLIAQAGLSWEVVESVPVHEQLKTRGPEAPRYLEHYRETLRNLGRAGIRTVCYNFMPVLDWTRTELQHLLADGSRALRFGWRDLAVFDCCILKRPGAEADYSSELLASAREAYRHMNLLEREALSANLLMGIPGERRLQLSELRVLLDSYRGIDAEALRGNLVWFLSGLMDTCAEAGIQLTLHPDDPPYSLLGLPRVAGSKADLDTLFGQVPEHANGLCFCTGSLGAGPHNDVPALFRRFRERVHFVHLRNVEVSQTGDFYEADHLEGRVDMYEVMRELVILQQERERPIPFRPDHGHQMLDDLNKTCNPGYSAIGRLRGLAELRGLELGIRRSLYPEDAAGQG